MRAVPYVATSGSRLTKKGEAEMSTGEQHREKTLAAGCDKFEAKPTDFEGLVGKIRSLLSRSAKP